jgi:peptide/nickel transport system ATP-binding protein
MEMSVKDLIARYSSSQGSVYAVENVSFDLPEGQSIGIAGESACGKSTLGLSIIQMLPGGKTKGKIILDGESILDLSETEFNERYRWKKISMIFQGAMNSLDPVFTIHNQFIEILKQHRFQGDKEKIILDAIHSVSLDENILKKYPHELSGGMKQRVVIAMALLLKPKFVIADEPTTALDVLIQAQIINLLKKLKKEGMSFMLITHDLAVLSEISDKIGIMYGGQMVEFGSSFEIYKNPKHPYTQGLLKSIPTLRGNAPIYIKGNPPSLLEPPTECRFLERCPHAIEKCKKLPPKFKTETGYVQCWLYEDE